MKRKEVKGEVDILRTPLDLYREYRGLSITELAMEAGISRQAVNMACLGMKVGMERLSRLAKVLHVDVEDLDQNVMPEGMKRHMVYIPGIMDAIRETIKRCPPCKLRGKADVIAAYLAAEDQDTEDVVGYLVNRCGTFGYQYLNFYLSKKHKKTESRNEKITEERKMDKCSLALYREYRDMNVNELADASGISRQSISAACSGREQLSDKSMGYLAQALCVEVEDIRWEADPRKMVHIPEETKKIERAVRQCRPRVLEKKLNNILSFLENWSENQENYGRLTEILWYLLQEDETERRAVAKELKEFTDMSLFQVDFSRFHLPRIEIGYEETDRKKGEYSAFVMFEDWVYELFGVERHMNTVEILSMWQKNMEGTYHIQDFPIGYHAGTYRPEENPDEFQGGLLDQIMEYMWQCDVYPEMEELYRQFCEEFLDMALNDSQITKIWQYREEGEHPELLLYIKRKAVYERILDRALEGISNPEIFKNVVADIFSSMMTGKNAENRILHTLGLEEI